LIRYWLTPDKEKDKRFDEKVIDLEAKGKSGILKMNQIEIWFSILVRKLLKRGDFSSVADLKSKVLAFIEYFNRTIAKPFKWTYKGKALAA
jgi:hypothetical protein